MSFDQFTCHKMFDKYDLMAAAEYDKHNTRVCRYRDLSRQRAIDAVVCNPLFRCGNECFFNVVIARDDGGVIR